jgi:C1A family cysteine protease
MRVLIVLAVLLAVLSVVDARRTTEKEYQKAFVNFINKYHKAYPHDEFFARYEIFKSNYDLIRAHNSKPSSYSMGVNQFADLTSAEFVERYTGLNPLPLASKPMGEMADPPAAIDWRTKNAVTPIKNQQQCGSCWAFSTTGSVEGAWAIHSGNLVSLSEQQLVDCSGPEGNQGCNGGLMDDAFQYIINNKGLCTEDSYPYTAVTGTCQTTCTPVATISAFSDVPQGNETALYTAVGSQPVSIAIEADQSGFQLYAGGVYDDASCGTQLDHGVLAVGYGHDDTSSKDFWIVKNSWGNTWGEAGYIRMVRGKNQCGLALMASFPTV